MFFFIPFVVPSSPPSNVRIINKTLDLIRIAWDDVPINGSNGVIEGYIVFFREKIRSLYKSIATSQNNVTLFGLKAFTEYSIRVLAYTRAGNGITSDEIRLVTSESGKSLSYIHDFIDILASVSFWPLLIIKLVPRSVPARLIIR